MRLTFIVPVLAALTACGDNLSPDEDQVSVNAEEDEPAPVPDDTTPTIRTFFLQDPGSCDTNSVFLLGRVLNADYTLNETATCQYDFGDGTTAFGCFAEHSFPEARTVTLTARDPATGAIATASDVVVGPAHLTATLDVASDGLSISWNATGLYGTSTVDVHLSFEPADKVIIDDPSILNAPTGTVRVTDAGTYTVTNHVTVTFGEEGGCGTSAVKTIDVICEKE